VQERIALSRNGLIAVTGMLTGGAVAAGALLHFVAAAPLPFVILAACVSPAALVLLLYVGHLLRAHPERQGHLTALKLLGVASICMGLLLLLDCVLPPMIMTTPVRHVTTREHVVAASLDRYDLELAPEQAHGLIDGHAATLEITPVFHRLLSAGLADSPHPLVDHSTANKVGMSVAGLAFLIPLGLMRFVPDRNDPGRNMVAYFTVFVPSYIVSLIAAGIWVKLLLVHVFGTVDMM